MRRHTLRCCDFQDYRFLFSSDVCHSQAKGFDLRNCLYFSCWLSWQSLLRVRMYWEWKALDAQRNTCFAHSPLITSPRHCTYTWAKRQRHVAPMSVAPQRKKQDINHQGEVCGGGEAGTSERGGTWRLHICVGWKVNRRGHMSGGKGKEGLQHFLQKSRKFLGTEQAVQESVLSKTKTMIHRTRTARTTAKDS